MSIVKKPFGQTLQGEPISTYTMTNATGAHITIANFGGIITEIWMPDRNGVLADINLGFDDAVPYRRSTTHWYSDYTGKEMVDMENYGGVSCYVPRNNPNRTKLNEAFRNTSWHDAAGWEVWYDH